MTPQEYITSKLQELTQPREPSAPNGKEELGQAVYKLVMSKKFRKYSVNPEYIAHIKSVIRQAVEKNEPIKFCFVFGGYKLWRLEEAPEPGWAELFSLMYYASWVKPICEIYPPGVWFDFYSDDAIVPHLNNVEASDIEAYLQTFRRLLTFLKPYQPANLNMTLNRVADQYESVQAFEEEVALKLEELHKTLPEGLPQLSDEQKAAISLNVKLRPGQDNDPHWQEKTQLLHDAYAQVSKRRPYYRTDDKLMVITLPIPNTIAIGTTKDSVMKFWIGTGVLKPKDGSFRQIILSPSQLERANYTWQAIAIEGLQGKNFNKVRTLT